MTGSSNLDPKLYRKVGLLEAKILAIKSQDILEDLTDIEYLSKLEAKSKKLVKNLAQKEIIPSTPKGLLESDANTLRVLIGLFDGKDWQKGKERMQLIRKALLSSTKTLEKSELDNFMKRNSEFQDLFEEKCKKFEDLNRNDFWIDHTSIDPSLQEYFLIQFGESFSKEALAIELLEILSDKENFKLSWSKKITEINNETRELLKKWEILKTDEDEKNTQLNEYFQKGSIKEVEAIVDETRRFPDILKDAKSTLSILTDMKCEDEELSLKCEEFLGKSSKKRLWAAENENLSKEISDRFLTLSNLIEGIDSKFIKGLEKTNLVSLKSTSLHERVIAEVRKSKQKVSSEERLQKIKRTLLYSVIFAGVCFYIPYFIEYKENRNIEYEKKIAEIIDRKKSSHISMLQKQINDLPNGELKNHLLNQIISLKNDGPETKTLMENFRLQAKGELR